MLFVVGFAVLGENPGEDDPGRIASFYADHGGRILTGETIILLSLFVFAWFLGAVAQDLRTAGQGRLASSSIALGASFVGAQTILQALDTTLAQSVADRGDTNVTLALHSLTWNIDVAASMLLAGYVLVVTVGLRRATITPGWHGTLGLLATVLLFLRATNWAAHGFWAPNGGYLYIGIGSALAWLAVTSGLLFRRAAPRVSPQA